MSMQSDLSALITAYNAFIGNLIYSTTPGSSTILSEIDPSAQKILTLAKIVGKNITLMNNSSIVASRMEFKDNTWKIEAPEGVS